MKENEEGSEKQYSSSSSKRSIKENEDVIENYSYEEFNNQENCINEDQSNNKNDNNEESQNSNEENKMLRDIEVNKQEASPCLQSQSEKEKDQQDKELMKEEEEVILEKNDLIDKEQEIKVDKTIFSKLSEEMYNRIVKQWNNKNNFSYDEFINERFLETYSDKINGDNNKKIKDFMKRNESYNSHKYYTFDTIHHRVDQINSIKKEKENDKIKMNHNQCDMFIENQFNYIQTKKNALEAMREEQAMKQSREMKDAPSVNKVSKLYPYKTKPKETGPPNQNKHKSTQKTKQLKEKTTKQLKTIGKLNKNEIKHLVDKLYQHKDISHKNGQCIRKCKSCYFDTNPCQSNTNNALIKSVSLLIESLIDAIEEEIFAIKNELISNKIMITNKEYNQLLCSMGYIPSNKPNSNLASKSNDLSKEVWTHYLLPVNPELNNKDSIEYNTLIIFLLSLEDFIKEGKIIKKIAPWILLNSNNFNSIKSKEIKTKYALLLSNRKEFISKKKREKHLMKSSYSTSSLFEPTLFKPKLNLASSTDYFIKSFHLESNYHPIHRLELSKSYNIIPTKHNAKMLQLKAEFEKQELAECTFHPNNKIPIKRSISNEVSNRLYSNNSGQFLKNKLKLMNNQSDINEKTGHSQEDNKKNSKKSAFNRQMFCPISKDYLFSKCIERYEKTRLEKQLKNYIKTKGVYSIDQLRLLAEQDLFKEEINERNAFRFDNEIKTNKESFDKYNKRKVNSSLTAKKELFLSFEIKIQNNKAILNYYKNDNPEKVVKDFAKKYHLSIEAKKQILQVLIKRLNANIDND